MTPKTASSLPGTSEEENSTVSPSERLTWRCSRRAMRDRPAIGSPCVPVVTTTSFSAGSLAAWSMSTMTLPGSVSRPISWAISMLRSIDRPLSATLRPAACAASTTACTR